MSAITKLDTIKVFMAFLGDCIQIKLFEHCSKPKKAGFPKQRRARKDELKQGMEEQ